MSWSVSFLGKPEAVAKALDEYSEKLGGQSRVEYDAAKPHLMALVKQNFASPPYVAPLIDLEASGSGTGGPEGRQLQRSLQVKIATQYKTVVDVPPGPPSPPRPAVPTDMA
jgi:hypothetical protein